jgi:alkylhydroperoxidase family enzyme
MVPADLDTLREHGFSDRAIHDAVQVIGYFNYITRVADALGVEPEDFIEPWGEGARDR